MVFGPPGSGKTMHADSLSKSLHLEHLSWGTIQRDQQKRALYSKLFNRIDSNDTDDKSRSIFISKIIKLELENINSDKNVILDGFPRRIEEARELLKIAKANNLEIKAIIRINPSLETAFKRFNERFACSKCNALYDNELNPPVKVGICDSDNNKLHRLKISRIEIEKDFLSYLSESIDAVSYLKPYSDTCFDVSGDDEAILVHSNILMKLKNHLKDNIRLFDRMSSSKLETTFGDFKMISYLSRIDYSHHLAVIKGEVENCCNVLVRVHSSCITGDIFGSQKCDCGDQLHTALKLIEKEGKGVLIYLFQEGRGINIVNKLMAYELQTQGLDTVEANEKLGFPSEMRKYEAAKDILSDLKIKSINLITNNPDKINKLTDLGIAVQQTTRLEIKPGRHNYRYLNTKREKMGHNLTKVLG